MSSVSFSVEIHLNPELRRRVLQSACALSVLGSAVILTLAATPVVAILALGLWLLWSGRELLRYRRCYGRWQRLSLLAPEGVARISGASDSESVRILPGSVILPRLAWLRLKAENGDVWGELVRGNARESEDWRRLQLVFRHLNTC